MVVSAQAHRANTLVAQRWLLILGLFAALPVPLAALMGRASQDSHFVTCSSAHPCPISISVPGVPLSALPMHEWVEAQAR